MYDKDICCNHTCFRYELCNTSKKSLCYCAFPSSGGRSLSSVVALIRVKPSLLVLESSTASVTLASTPSRRELGVTAPKTLAVAISGYFPDL